jgi:hypothetical protein
MTDKPPQPHDPTDMTHPLYDAARDPTSPLYEGSETDVEGGSDPVADGAYKVGPGFPPKQYKWKKGCPSPYPKGRPRKAPSMKPDLRKALESALNEKVVITKDKKAIVLTKAVLGIQQLVNQFAKGDRHARHDLFQYATLLGVDLHAKDIIAEVLGVNEEAIVDAAFRRREQQAAPASSPNDHIKAPPDLLDDDVAKTESDVQPDTSPQPKAPRPSDPVLDEHGKPVPMSDIRYVRAIAARRLAQQKRNQGGS